LQVVEVVGLRVVVLVVCFPVMLPLAHQLLIQ
jgi:hypothetical protein